MLKQYALLLPALLVLAGLSSISSHAQDCTVSTSPPKLVGKFPGVDTDELNKEDGYYAASLENGDQILVYFAPCDLALRGHYLVRDDGDQPALRDTVALFVSYLLPAQGDKERVLEQIREIDLDGSTVIGGNGDRHKITVVDSKSAMFAKEIHYEWIPPLH